MLNPSRGKDITPTKTHQYMWIRYFLSRSFAVAPPCARRLKICSSGFLRRVRFQKPRVFRWLDGLVDVAWRGWKSWEPHGGKASCKKMKRLKTSEFLRCVDPSVQTQLLPLVELPQKKTTEIPRKMVFVLMFWNYSEACWKLTVNYILEMNYKPLSLDGTLDAKNVFKMSPVRFQVSSTKDECLLFPFLGQRADRGKSLPNVHSFIMTTRLKTCGS